MPEEGIQNAIKSGSQNKYFLLGRMADLGREQHDFEDRISVGDHFFIAFEVLQILQCVCPTATRPVIYSPWMEGTLAESRPDRF